MSYLAVARRVLKEQTRETENSANKAKEVPALVCVECGHSIASVEPETWWGLERVHRDCGEAAWRREWQGAVLPADAEAAR